jgi:uncharacterized membrane protein
MKVLVTGGAGFIGSHTVNTMKNSIWIINLVSLLFVFFIFVVPSIPVRVILGIPLMFFIPGFVWMSVLFPRRSQMNIGNRLAYSVILSVIVILIVALLLNYTPPGITLVSVVWSIVATVLIGSAIAAGRQSGLPDDDRATLSILKVNLKNIRLPKSVLERTLLGMLGVVLLGAIGVIGYAVANPLDPQKYTEFYVLDSRGEINYQVTMKMGNSYPVKVGIVNHERAAMVYQIEVWFGDVKWLDIAPPKLADEEKWEEEVLLVPQSVGNNQKIQIILFKNDEENPYLRPLQLWVNVVP